MPARGVAACSNGPRRANKPAKLKGALYSSVVLAWEHNGMYNSFWLAGLLLKLTEGKLVDSSGIVHENQLFQHAMAIPSRIYPYSSDQGNQSRLGPTAT